MNDYWIRTAETEPLDVYELIDLYEESLNDAFGSLEINGVTYKAALILKRTDYVNYNEGYDNWLEMMVDSDQLFQIEDKYYKQDPNRTV